MNKQTLSIILKLLIASLLVGLALDFFEISPTDIIHDIPETVVNIFNTAVELFTWSGKYILLGAIIVVPLWILMNLPTLKNLFRGKR